MPGLSRNQRIQWLPIAVTVVCTAALALLLFTGVRLAARLQSASAALQLASSLTAQPQFLRSELTLIQRGLETRTYVGNSLRALEASRSASNQAYAHLDAAMRKGGLATRTDTAGLYARALALWQPLDAGLARLAQTGRTDLYADSAGGSTLTAGGAALKRSVDELLAAQTHATTALESELGTLAAQLREAVVHDGQALRGLLLGGAGLATLLLATMLYFAWRAGRAAEAAAEAERQVGNLLGTVREGLFLVTADGRIGSAYSDSLPALLRASAPAGQAFEELLRPLVDDKTLQSASRYLGLLRRQKVNEELIESVNPLSQIEVSFPRPQGPAEVRYLSFSFRRARGAGLVPAPGTTCCSARWPTSPSACCCSANSSSCAPARTRRPRCCSSCCRPDRSSSAPSSPMSRSRCAAAMRCCAAPAPQRPICSRRSRACSARCTPSRAKPRRSACSPSCSARTRSRTCWMRCARARN